MTRRGRLLRNVAVSGFAILLLGGIAVIRIVQTDWFRNYVREKIVVATQDAIGGRSEIGSFSFDWRTLEATVRDFVIHGTEGPDSAPFLRAAHVTVRLRLFTSLRRVLNVSYLVLDQPELNVIVDQDGKTNVPTPSSKSASSETPLASVVDLAIGHFELNHGLMRYNSSIQPIDLKANNLQVSLAYSLLKQGYEGQLSLQPLYVVNGRKTPVVFSLNVPLTLGRDRISVQDATVTTALSALKVSGSVENMRHPVTSAHVLGQVSLVDLNKLQDLSLEAGPKSASTNLVLDAEAAFSQDSVKIGKLHLALGNSTVDAKGSLNDSRNPGFMNFSSNLDLAEISRLAKSSQKPTGMIALEGRASFRGKNIDLDQFRLRAFGGEIDGRASLEQFARYKVTARIDTFNLQTAEQRLGIKLLPYSGLLSGTLEASGDMSSGGENTLEASTVLKISPDGRGIPLSGQLNISYRASNGEFASANSFLRLPNTSLTFSGSMRTGVRVDVTSRDVHDLLVAIPDAEPSPVKLNNGQAAIRAVVSGTMKNPSIAGQLTATKLAIVGRQFDSLSADFTAIRTRMSVADAAISRGAMRTQFSGSIGLADWSPGPNEPLAVNAAVTNGDLADMLALAGQNSAGYSGAVTAGIAIGGTIGNPIGSATLEASNGTAVNQPFDQAQVRVVLSDRRVSIPNALVLRDTARLNLSADYSHSADSFTTGHLNAHITVSGLDLSQIRSLVNEHPDASGAIQADVTVSSDSGKVGGNQEFAITSVDGNVNARRMHFEGEDYGDLTATTSTSMKTVSYNLSSNFAGSQIRAQGHTELVGDHATNLDASLGNLSIERVLKVVKVTDIPAKGVLSGTLHLTGTLNDPQGNADVNLTNATVYDEPLDRAHARVQYLSKSVTVEQLELTAGPSRLNLSAKFEHPVADLTQGDLQFQIESGALDLARIRNLQERRPGLGGSVQVSGSGKAALGSPLSNGSQNLLARIALQDLNARITTNGLVLRGKALGKLDVSASTDAGRLNFKLDSNVANAAIHGTGNAQLGGDYPVSADLAFTGLTWANLEPLIGSGETPSFDAETSGKIVVDGPISKPEQLTGTVRLSTLKIRPAQAPKVGGQPVTIQNQGDIAMKLEKGAVRIETARLTGPETDITASGTAAVGGKLDIRVDAKANLALLHSLDSDIFSSGSVTAAITVQGTTQDPRATGRLELHSASVSYADLPAGLQNAAGVVIFNGNSATIQTLSADSGGGKIAFTGFVTEANELRFALHANATGVRVRVQQGVSMVTTASVNLTGTTHKSQLSGTATVDRLSYRPQTDIGSILTRSGSPVQAPISPSALLANMSLDILVRTSSSTAVQAALAENLEVTTNLRIRGTAAQPGAVGTVRLTHGQLVFFGSNYTISSGTISFYNPLRIEPTLQLSLETQAKGVTVVLSVTGPIDNMKLSYTSDPPLQFEEIVSLLAAGSTPTSDPTLLANQPSQPSQTFQERGESAILSKAVADPVSSRLQRVFGVSQLKIDPSFTSGSELPQARVTLQQQVATNLVFTYVTALDNANTQVIRIEWSMTPQWSAAANRDENGLFSINLQYKKEFR